MTMKDTIEVSVFCITYNHENYIRKCLDGLVNQETNFKYEILIHDDVSTDSTRKIIDEYKKKYPDLIRIFYPKENRFAKGINIFNSILFPEAKGKYIACCEGDDFWCSNQKLQRQYDFMESHYDFSGCLHNTLIHDLSNKMKDSTFNNYNTIHILTEKEIFLDWKVHTSSFFFKRECFDMPKFTEKYWFGDYVRLTYSYLFGKIAVLPEIMSVYNSNNLTGLTQVSQGANYERQRITYLDEYDKYTKYVYHKRLEKIKNIIYFNTQMYDLVNCDHDDFKNIFNETKSNRRFIEYKRSSIRRYIKLSILFFSKTVFCTIKHREY